MDASERRGGRERGERRDAGGLRAKGLGWTDYSGKRNNNNNSINTNTHHHHQQQEPQTATTSTTIISTTGRYVMGGVRLFSCGASHYSLRYATPSPNGNLQLHGEIEVLHDADGHVGGEDTLETPRNGAGVPHAPVVGKEGFEMEGNTACVCVCVCDSEQSKLDSPSHQLRPQAHPETTPFREATPTACASGTSPRHSPFWTNAGWVRGPRDCFGLTTTDRLSRRQNRGHLHKSLQQQRTRASVCATAMKTMKN